MTRAAEVTWRRGLLKKGPGLCHGAAGNGYALLSVYRCTRDPRALARAKRFAQWTVGGDDEAATAFCFCRFTFFLILFYFFSHTTTEAVNHLQKSPAKTS